MKPIFILFTALASVCIPASAQTEKRQQTKEVTESPRQTSQVTIITFHPEAKAKMLEFFETYKREKNGLPPGFIVNVKELPTAWKAARIMPNSVIPEIERSKLLPIPTDLQALIPFPATGVQYYLAGSNIIAVDADYRVVDVVQIPTIKFVDD